MYDPTTSKLHFYPNATTPGKDIVAPILSSEQPGNAAFFLLYSTPFLGFGVQIDGDLPRQARDNCKDGNLRSLNATVSSLSSAIFHVEGANGAKNAFLEPFIYVYIRPSCPDRLGTNIGKVEKRVACFAAGVTIEGFTLTETRATFLDQYEVPSGGDWSVHRGATVEIVREENGLLFVSTFHLSAFV
jgi:hypothetical protein